MQRLKIFSLFVLLLFFGISLSYAHVGDLPVYDAVWSGAVTQSQPADSGTFTLNLRKGKVGSTIGSWVYRPSGCSGSLTLTSISESKMTLEASIAKNVSGRYVCLGQGQITLTVVGDKQATFRMTYPAHKTVVTGTLHKEDGHSSLYGTPDNPFRFASYTVPTTPIEITGIKLCAQPDGDQKCPIDAGTFHSQIDKIFASFIVIGGEANERLTAKWYYVQSAGKKKYIGQSVIQLKADQEATRGYFYMNPRGEWPAGTYRLEVTTSTGERAVRDFKILDA